MSDDVVSEQDFLLAELRYSLVQIYTQLDRLDEGSRPAGAAFLNGLREDEIRYLAGYERALQMSSAKPAEEVSFQILRDRTIELLASRNEPWPSDVLTMAREHIRGDRLCATRLADLGDGQQPVTKGDHRLP